VLDGKASLMVVEACHLYNYDILLINLSLTDVLFFLTFYLRRGDTRLGKPPPVLFGHVDAGSQLIGGDLLVNNMVR
jgi:hypothetical protein